MASIKQMKTFKVKVKSKKEVAENTLIIELEKPVDFEFQAGQFIMMIIPQLDSNTEGGNERAMSIASPPYFENLQLVFRKSETAFKKASDKLVEGNEIEIKGPYGAFDLSKIMEQEQVVFLTGGIGITPIRSMLLEAINKKIEKKFFLFYSNIEPETSIFLEEFENINNPNFEFIPTMTEIKESSIKWEGEQGRINIEMLKKYIPDIKIPVYFIVGSDGFVQTMRNMLEGAGVEDKKMKFERF